MPDEPLRTLRQVADMLDLPESTVRYYRDAFLDHIPSIGTGRRRRYPPAALAVLRSVAEAYAAGRSRRAILASLEGGTPPAAAGAAASPGAASRPAGEVSNLELLAAIVDGEREQRDALWQMAREIVRLTDVLEGQEKVLTEIADHAGVRPALAAAQPLRALTEGSAGAWTQAAATSASAPPSVPPPPSPPRQPVAAAASAPATPPAQPPVPEPGLRAEAVAGPGSGATEMERLRSELESERELVERLREAKLKLEHRVSHAEAALEEQHPKKRPSMLGRLLNPGGA